MEKVIAFDENNQPRPVPEEDIVASAERIYEKSVALLAEHKGKRHLLLIFEENGVRVNGTPDITDLETVMMILQETSMEASLVANGLQATEDTSKS
jgi:hypothetical protein